MWESGLGSGIAAANVVLGGARELDPFERRLIDEGVVRHVPVGPNMLEDLDTAVGTVRCTSISTAMFSNPAWCPPTIACRTD